MNKKTLTTVQRARIKELFEAGMRFDLIAIEVGTSRTRVDDYITQTMGARRVGNSALTDVVCIECGRTFKFRRDRITAGLTCEACQHASLGHETLCVGTNCQVKKTCCRYLATPGSYPTFMAFWQTIGFTPAGGCKYRLQVATQSDI